MIAVFLLCIQFSRKNLLALFKGSRVHIPPMSEKSNASLMVIIVTDLFYVHRQQKYNTFAKNHTHITHTTLAHRSKNMQLLLCDFQFHIYKHHD